MSVLGGKTIDQLHHERGVVLVQVSTQLAPELRVWSEPVQIMLEPIEGEDALCDLILRKVEDA